MTVDITMIVKATIEFPDDYRGFGNKKPGDWTETEIQIFKNDIAVEFSDDLNYLNSEDKSMVKNRRVVSFE